MFCKMFLVLSFFLFLAHSGPGAGGVVSAGGRKELLTQDNDQGDTVKVVDKATKRPLAGNAVRIFRANSIRCITTPCPQNDIDWSGVTDAKGIVRVPSDIMIRTKAPGPAATFAAADHVGFMDLTKDLRRISKTSWIIALTAQHTGQNTTSTSKDQDEEIPEWLSQLIEREKAGPPANPPAKVFRYTYREEIVYYIPPRCCDIPSRLYDREGKQLCLPDGGMTGAGDKKCPSFFKERRDEKLIWKDTRVRR